MKKMALKIALDIAMTILFIALMDTAFTGLELHEIIGLGICGAFAAHKLLNLDWIKRLVKSLKNGKAGNRIRVLLAVDAMLLVGMTLLVISGVFISEVLFAGSGLESGLPWKLIHSFSAYGTLVLIAVHLGLHWKMIMKAFGRMFGVRPESRPRKILLRIAALAIVALGIKSTVDTNFFAHFAVTQKQGGEMTQPRGPVVTDGSNTASDEGAGNSDALGVSALSAAAVSDTPTLEDFLSNMVCTSCGHRCSLLNPRCGRGQQQAQQARSEYETAYGGTEDSASTEDSSSSSGGSNGEAASENSAAAQAESDESAAALTENTVKAGGSPDGGNESGFSVYLEYLAVLGMLATATHYLAVTGSPKKENGEKRP